MVFEMSRRLSRYKRGRRAVDLSASRFDGERQKTAPPPARQPSLLFTALPSDFFLFLFSPLPPSSSDITSNPCSLFVLRSTLLCPSLSLSLSFHDRKSSYPPILNCPTCFKPIYIYPLQNSDTTSIHIYYYYYYYYIRIRRRIKINKAPAFLSHPPRYRRSRIAETNVIVYCSSF